MNIIMSNDEQHNNNIPNMLPTTNILRTLSAQIDIFLFISVNSPHVYDVLYYVRVVLRQ